MKTKINVRMQLKHGLSLHNANNQGVWSELHNNGVIIYKVSLFINRHKDLILIWIGFYAFLVNSKYRDRKISIVRRPGLLANSIIWSVLGLLIVYEFRAPNLSSKTKKNNSIDSLPDEIGKQILQMLDIRPRAKSHNTMLDSTVSLDCNYNILREKYGSF